MPHAFAVIDSVEPGREPVAVVFGGGRGIGEAVARGFAGSGFRVVVVSRTVTQVESVARKIGGGAMVADIADAEAVADVFSRCGRVDAVVNAAAIQGGDGAIGELWQTRPEAVGNVMRINVLGSYHVLRESILSMQRHGVKGSIILFSGGGSCAPRARFAAYGASKTALLRIVEVAALELREAGSGIRVFAVAPGPVHTAMTEEVIRRRSSAGQREVDLALATASGNGLPAVRAARVCQFLAGARSGGLSGRLVHVNEDYESLARQDLTEDSGCLRRIGYQVRGGEARPLRDSPRKA